MKYPFSRSTNPTVDLSSQDAFQDGAPFVTFDRLRKDDPLSWTDFPGQKGFWSITRHADIMDLNKQFGLLSSAKGIRMEDQSEDEYEARKTFQETDPPEHAQFRKMVSGAFAKSSISKYEDQIRNIVTNLLDHAFEQESFDAVSLIARELPMQMLAQITGVPEKDTSWLVEKGDALISNADPDYTDHVIDKVDTEEYRFLPFRSPAAIELFDYADNILRKMEQGEQFGILNSVVAENSKGERLSDDQFKNFFCLLVAAGNDTTRYSISATIHALANDPELLAQIKADDFDQWDKASDEFIRWASPTTHFRRTATRDFEYHGKQIKAGDKVLLWFLAANRDENVFDRPYEINLLRSPNKHIAFGQGGPHLCLGMWLAKLEVKIVIQELAKRVKRMEQAGPHDYLRSNFIHGIKKLPIKIEAE